MRVGRSTPRVRLRVRVRVGVVVRVKDRVRIRVRVKVSGKGKGGRGEEFGDPTMGSGEGVREKEGLEIWVGLSEGEGLST